ncbi:hypothetical protein FRC04_009291 [Tulasnella sp. 424]|nr:hypothetical protein FRC04_009291 [Tulasnella sp. 424]
MSTYDAEFYWFGPANEVVLTGSFDNWSKSVHMEKTPAGFSGKVKLPYGQKVDYKYVVDGQWQVNPDFPTTYDWQGNINNYIVTPNEPELKSLPTPPPDLIIKTPASPANDEPVTPINLPAPVAAAVTPMEVPQSAVSPHADLELDPVVSRIIVESILEAEAKETPKEEKAEEIVQAAAVDEPKVEEIVQAAAVDEPKVEEAAAVDEPKVEAPKPVEPEAEESKEAEPVPTIIVAAEVVASPSEIPAEPVVESTKPSPDDVKPDVIVAQTEAIALDSPVKPTAPALPEAKPAAESITEAPAPTPAAVPLPETPAVTPAVEKQPEATGSHFSTTTDGTKPEAPVTPTKKSEDKPVTVKRGSTRSARMFSLSGRRASHDSAGESGTLKAPKTPGTPGSTKSTDTQRKKKNSFLTKVHDLFHPHHKQEKA